MERSINRYVDRWEKSWATQSCSSSYCIFRISPPSWSSESCCSGWQDPSHSNPGVSLVSLLVVVVNFPSLHQLTHPNKTKQSSLSLSCMDKERWNKALSPFLCFSLSIEQIRQQWVSVAHHLQDEQWERLWCRCAMILLAWPCTLVRRRPQDKAAPSIIQHRHCEHNAHERSCGDAGARGPLSAGCPVLPARAWLLTGHPVSTETPAWPACWCQRSDLQKHGLKRGGGGRKSTNPVLPPHLPLVGRLAGTGNRRATLANLWCFKTFLYFDANELWNL